MENRRLICVGLSMLTGTIYTIGVAVVSVPNHRARLNNYTLSSCKAALLTGIYVALMVCANMPLIAATAYGPVAVVVPVAIGFYMLTNMLLQVCVGMSNYDKTMQVGTVVLAIAATQLTDVGPTDPVEQADPVELLEQPIAIGWLSLLVFLLVCGLCSMPKVIKQGRDSLSKLLAFTVVVGCAAAINNSISKAITVLDGPPFYMAMGLYVVLGVTSSVSSAIGNAGLNNAVSVPAMSCLQVIANGLTGVFVWGDVARIEQPTAYTGVYLLFCLGVYLCTSADHVAGLFRWHELGGQTDFLSHTSSSSYGQALENLFSALRDAARDEDNELAEAFETYLDLGSTHHTMGEKELLALCKELIDLVVTIEDEKALVPVLAKWMEEYSLDYQYVAAQDTTLQDKVHALAERRKTQAPMKMQFGKSKSTDPKKDLEQPLMG